MTYATQQDLVDAFGDAELIALTDIGATPANGIDAGRVARAIAAAEGEVEGYLATRYQVPLATTPANVKQAVCDVARYRLYRDNAPDLVMANYNAAIRLCRDIANGTIKLPLPGGDEPARAEALVAISSGGRIFARELFGGDE